MPANARLSLNNGENSPQQDPVQVSEIKLDLNNEPSHASPQKDQGSQGTGTRAANEKAMLKNRPRKEIATKSSDKKAGCMPVGCIIFWTKIKIYIEDNKRLFKLNE